MKLIMRADDLGFSEAVNYGIEKSVKEGLITCVGLMTNMPSATHGYQLIKDEKICIGQHTNICVGTPLSDPRLIPSLVQDNGQFCSSKEFRSRLQDTIVEEEAEIEIEAQLKKFIEITGRKPDYFEAHAVQSKNFFKALKKVAKKYDLFYENPIFDQEWEQVHQIYGFDFAKLDHQNLYDPHIYIQEQYQKYQDKECCIAVFHPGYLDQYILTHSSFTLIRPMECDFLCSQWLKDWIQSHQIEIIDFSNYRK